LNRAANAYWIDDRLRSQRVALRAVPALRPARDLSREIIGTPAEVRRRGGIIPSWVIFGMIMLATLALCVTVTMRTHAEASVASQELNKISAQVEGLRKANAALKVEVDRLHKDPRAIESAAREQLDMVRSNEIVVPVE
jgi:cell division protein FtsL